MPHSFSKTVTGVLALLVLLGASGCASYYSHYSVFPATNSVGEPRKVKVSWQTAEYPDWWPSEDKATAVTLETQCSTRVWRLFDDSQREETGCADGIHACGNPEMDVLVATDKRAGPKDPCLYITDKAGAQRITELGNQVQVQVQCRAAEPEQNVDGETMNQDYLRASIVPYDIQVRKAPRGSLAARAPRLDESVCDAD